MKGGSEEGIKGMKEEWVEGGIGNERRGGRKNRGTVGGKEERHI